MNATVSRERNNSKNNTQSLPLHETMGALTWPKEEVPGLLSGYLPVTICRTMIVLIFYLVIIHIKHDTGQSVVPTLWGGATTNILLYKTILAKEFKLVDRASKSHAIYLSIRLNMTHISYCSQINHPYMGMKCVWGCGALWLQLSPLFFRKIAYLRPGKKSWKTQNGWITSSGQHVRVSWSRWGNSLST